MDAVLVRPARPAAVSRLGVVGLTEACRRGTVTVVNPLGSGILESPGLLPFLPRLARAILGETLKLASVPTHWCGNDAERSHVLAHFERDGAAADRTAAGPCSRPC